jgi:hypothetical protein
MVATPAEMSAGGALPDLRKQHCGETLAKSRLSDLAPPGYSYPSNVAGIF